MTAFDAYPDAVQLPSSLRLKVPAEYGDLNGHMNVRHHVAIHDDAGWAIFAGLGFDRAYIDRRRRNFFDLEHHLRYLAEVLIGDEVSVHVRLLDRSTKVVHLLSYLVNRTRHEVAGTQEITTVHVDLDTRRSVTLDSHDARLLDKRLDRDRSLPWASSTCGSRGVNRQPGPGPSRA